VIFGEKCGDFRQKMWRFSAKNVSMKFNGGNTIRPRRQGEISELFFSYHPIPWRDSISRPLIPQAETIPLDHDAGVEIRIVLHCQKQGDQSGQFSHIGQLSTLGSF
jgi:hypothetical protein